MLSAQAHYSSLRPPPCNVFDPTSRCEKLESSDTVFLYVALYLVAAGMAGIKASIPSHGADQFDEKDPREAKTMSSFFNGLLFALCIGGAVSLTLYVWLDDHKGWDVGFGVSAIAMFLALIVAVLGWPLYRIHVVQGSSVLLELIQVCLHETPSINFHSYIVHLPIDRTLLAFGLLEGFCCSYPQ